MLVVCISGVFEFGPACVEMTMWWLVVLGIDRQYVWRDVGSCSLCCVTHWFLAVYRDCHSDQMLDYHTL